MTDRPPYPAWIYRQSAVLPCRWRKDKLEILLISSRSGKRWVLPKGIVEPGMNAADSALKEAVEEAGVEGSVDEKPLGSYRYRKWGGVCEVEVYPMRVTNELDEWIESRIRRRRWFTLRKTLQRVDNKGLRRLIKHLPAAAFGPDSLRPAETSVIPAARLIYLFRHAKSSWDDPELDDFDRPLAPRGMRACKAMGRYFALGDIHPDRIVCSAAIRTKQTLERVLPSLGEQPVIDYYRGLYGAGPKAMLKRLQRTDDEARSVMLVAHNPGIQSLALQLADSGNAADLDRLEINFPTGALAMLVYHGKHWSELDFGACELHSFVCPRDIGPKPRS